MAAGQHYTQHGGASEYTCLPYDPQFNQKIAGYQLGNYIYGAEYETHGSINSHLNDNNVPCAVCYVPNRAAQLMIPAKRECPIHWTKARLFCIKLAETNKQLNKFRTLCFTKNLSNSD